MRRREQEKKEGVRREREQREREREGGERRYQLERQESACWRPLGFDW